ncbi:MAG: DUF4159 domain-containing protein [Deltaproteobacteria bacterium]|nr:MAG: DUF4159 domain-containing protein [Deltaproteobacteria bacterium]
MSSASRRQFLKTMSALAGLTVLPSRSASGFGTANAFDMPLLRYDSPTWNSRPSAIRRLLIDVDMRTNIRVVQDPAVVRPTIDELFTSPMLAMTGDRAFPSFRDEEREALRRFLGAGGLWFVDSAEDRLDGGFRESMERELSALFPGETLRRLPSDHVVFQTYYLVDGAPGRVRVANHLDGLTLDGRTAVIYSHNDMMGAWARDRFGNPEFAVHPGGDRQREMATRLGVNLAMFALTLDYKEDQVHVPHILRRRRWRVD